MSRVELLRYTSEALDLLLETKNTRLTTPGNPADMSEEEKREHLAYMRDTIKSSWEFVTYVFRISEVTRAFTHQLVRTRTGSYAQQAMRVVDARDAPVTMPDSVVERPLAYGAWCYAEGETREAYGAMVDAGVPIQDARGILPTNVQTSIIAQFNLRTLHDMAQLRLCTRTQGEYQDAFRAMREEVIAVHPWTEDFLQVHCVQHGSCAFPRYGNAECPVYLPEMDNSEVRERAARKFWSVRHEAAPVARDGKAQ